MRSRIYYGWANLAMAALAMVATLPGRTQGLGLITEPLIADLHVDRVTYATINLWATLIGAAFCLPCGRLLDRYGSRIVLTLTVLFLGATVVGMRWMQGLAALSIAITLTRGFGQSALSVVSLALVGKWFARRLNLAMGVYALLVGIGFIAAFPSVGAAVVEFGWRAPWGMIGWVLLLVVAPLCWLIVRNQPEDRGLELDGVADPAPQLSDLTTGEALRSPAFWIFALSSSLFGLVYSGISLFNESILVERRLQRVGLSRRAGDQHDAGVTGEFRGRMAGDEDADSETVRDRDGGARGSAGAVAAGQDLRARPYIWSDHGDRGRGGDGGVLFGLGTGVRTGAPGPDPGLRADDDGVRVGGGTAGAGRNAAVDGVVQPYFQPAGGADGGARPGGLVRGAALPPFGPWIR